MVGNSHALFGRSRYFDPPNGEVARGKREGSRAARGRGASTYVLCVTFAINDWNTEHSIVRTCECCTVTCWCLPGCVPKSEPHQGYHATCVTTLPTNVCICNVSVLGMFSLDFIFGVRI
ncbi:hypothetical protein E2C01_086706 [Portunus trituberculatus]|uniref:Uncharacterized protein n=1 Tax=Portunus trituberculatus TaxID=210409 RepID=A0A5B7JH50_PORTR|nr:hypothetical protein [Portunus trituberculatus]